MMISRKSGIALAVIGAIAASFATFGSAEAASAGYCKQKARDYANSVVRPTSVATGAVAGAVVGGILGSFGANLGKGAAIGAGVGAVGGTASYSIRWHRAYDDAYARCMGYGVKTSYGAPKPWSPAWYDYCAARYKSFNPRTGYYTVKGGGKRFCK
ncbi:MAG: BA14K family protein [Hyphomicrobiales bacterium]